MTCESSSPTAPPSKQDRCWQLSRRAGGNDVVADAEERLRVPNQVATATADGDIVVRGEVIGVPLADGGPNINVDPRVGRGRSLNETDRGQPTSLVERNFAVYYDLPADGTLTLSGGRQLEYVGHANTPEYFMVISEGGGIFAQASYAAVFTSLETAGEIAGLPGSVNERSSRSSGVPTAMPSARNSRRRSKPTCRRSA